MDLTEDCRCEFEKWCIKNDFSIRRDKAVKDFYAHTHVNEMFDAWVNAWNISRSNRVANNVINQPKQ